MEIIASQAQARVPVTVFTIRGQINSESAPELQAEAEKAMKAGSRHLLLDLTEVTYISSAGLRVMAYLMVLLRKWADQDPAAGGSSKDSGRRSAHLKLLNPSPDVWRTLTMVGFDLYLETCNNYQEALNAF